MVLLLLVGAIAAGWCPSAAGQVLSGYRQEALLEASPVFGGRRVEWTRAGTHLMAVAWTLAEHPRVQLDIWELHVEGAPVATWCYRLTPEELGVTNFAGFQVAGSALFLRDKDRIVSYDLVLRRLRGAMKVPRYATIECLAPDQLVKVDPFTGTHHLMPWTADATPELGPPISLSEPLRTPQDGTRGYSRDRLFGYLLDYMGQWVARVELGGQRVVRLPRYARQEGDSFHSLQLVSGRDLLCFVRRDPVRLMLWDLRADELWRSVPLPEAVVEAAGTVCLTDDATALVFAGPKDLWRCDLASQQWDRTARRANGWPMRVEAVPGSPFVGLVPTKVGLPFELIDARRLHIVFDTPGCHISPIVNLQLANDVLAASSSRDQYPTVAASPHLITTYSVAEQQRVGWIEHPSLSPYWSLGPAGDRLHIGFGNDPRYLGSFDLAPGPAGWRIATVPATFRGRVNDAPAIAPFNGWVLAPAHKPGEVWCRTRGDDDRGAVERRRLADGEVLGRVTLQEHEGALAIDSDEGILITSNDYAKAAYRLADGQRLWEKSILLADAVAAGGRVAACEVDDGRAVVLDAYTGKEIWSERAGGEDSFQAVRLSGNGRLLLLLTGGDTKELRLVELPGGKVVFRAACADIAPTAIAISYDGQRIALADQDRRILVFRRVD